MQKAAVPRRCARIGGRFLIRKRALVRLLATVVGRYTEDLGDQAKNGLLYTRRILLRGSAPRPARNRLNLHKPVGHTCGRSPYVKL